MRLATRLMLCAVLGLSSALAACESSSGDGGGTTPPAKDTVSSADPGPGTPEVKDETDTTAEVPDVVTPPVDEGKVEDPGKPPEDKVTPPEDKGGPTCDLPTAFPGGTAHVTHLEFVDPTKLDELQCDSNNDGKSDASDVSLNTALTTGIAAALNLGASLTKSIEDFSLIFLLQMEGYSGADATGITTNLMLGSKIEDQPDPTCDDIANAGTQCEWAINPKTSFNDECKPLVSMADSKVAGGKLDAGPKDISLAITFAGNTVNLEVKTARLNGEVSGTVDLKGGRLCGTVTKQAVLDGLNNACDVPDDQKPTWCSYITLIPTILSCDPCGIALKLDAGATKGLKLGPQPK